MLQAVFEKMGYAEWVGLSTEDKKVKSAPYRALIKDTWARLKRSKPCDAERLVSGTQLEP